jgi:hypothetical protein
MWRAEKAAAMGNVVRSLIFLARAAQYARGELAARARSALRASLDRLLRRLQLALEIRHEELKAWRDTLLALVYQTPHGIWPAEARLLYDLQKVCVDFERGIYTVDLVEWALSLGSRPIKRPLPSQRDVLMSKHLHSAASRLPVVRLSDNQRRQLAGLLRTAAESTEDRLRRHFRPRLAEALDEVDLKPRNVPERVARNKLIEELLDRIVDRGFLTMGDLRDALSRNNLKLPDFSRPGGMRLGDQLLRADRKLATSLDGVYRRGEFYLRWMQQLSSLAFGTHTGRLLTRFVAVPFGGSFLAVAGVKHVVDVVRRVESERTTSEWVAVFALGVFLMGLVNVGWFRKGVWEILKSSCRAVRELLIDPVVAVFRSEFVQRIFRSRLFAVTSRFLLKPLVFTAAVYLLLPLELVSTRESMGIAATVFLGVNLLLNSRLGRELEEVLADWLVQSWHRFGLRILTGLFWLVMDVFKGILENVERLLYTVDEWLRFRTGESRFSFVAKAVLGIIWFYLTYIIRFCVNLLIEPQINPIKHFPVVTVSHKVLIPCIPAFGTVLQLALEKGLGVTIDRALAITIATTVTTSIPGIFGFLVWELRGNWRLYAANRPDRLVPVPIGQHGESMVRLLKPGFHSGTVPKRFAKLRRAERKARVTGSWRGVRKHLQVLQHIELAVRRYVDRELVALLAETRAWQTVPLEIAAVYLGSNRVRALLACPPLGGEPLEVAFELESGWLLAGIARPGWLEQLSAEQRQLLSNALAGLYKTSGAELVRQQVAALLPRADMLYKVTERGLMVSPDATWEAGVLYEMGEGEVLTPQPIGNTTCSDMPTLHRSELVFSVLPISWIQWVETWNDDQTDRGYHQPQLGSSILSVAPSTPATAT